MPRLQKVTEKVFAGIAETPQKKGAYTTFLDIDDVLGLPEEDRLTEMKTLYADLVTAAKKTVSTLAMIEEIVIQIRCKGVIDQELRLSVSRQYIYARSIFYRRDNQINDIRIVVGTTEKFPEPLEDLIEHVGFRSTCIQKLEAAMEKEIKTNINNLKTIIRDEEIESN